MRLKIKSSKSEKQLTISQVTIINLEFSRIYIYTFHQISVNHCILMRLLFHVDEKINFEINKFPHE